MNGIDIDPYKILGVPNDSTLEQVKDAYRILAHKHHPDKGGNADTFKIMKSAFKIIIANIKKGVPIPKTQASTFGELKTSSQNYQVHKQPEPHEFFGQNKPINPNKEFSSNDFNQKFMGNKNNNEDYLLATTDNDYRENRTKEQLLSEQAAIDGEIGQIKPMFNGKEGWDRNAFNRMFEHVNGKPETKITALQGYEEPIALTSGLQPFTEIDDDHKLKQTGNIVSLPFGTLDDSFAGYKNPNAVDNDLLSQFKSQADITNANTIESDYGAKMKNRLNDYRSAQFNYHPPPANPSQLPDKLLSTKSAMDKISQKGLSDIYSQKLNERNQVTNNLRYGTDNAPVDRSSAATKSKNSANDRNLPVNSQHHAMPIMDYPRSSNNGTNTSTVDFPRTSNNGNNNNASTIDYPRNSNNGNNNNVPNIDYSRSNNHQFTTSIPNNQSNVSDDYFMKIPNTPQIYNNPYNPYAQPPINFNSTNNNNFNQVELIQKQLSDLQKTVNQQNKIITGLKKNKGNRPIIKN